MNNPLIRKAVLTDLDNLVKLENESFTYDQMSRQSYRALLKKNSAEIVIAEINDALIASATIFFRKDSTQARIYSIAVKPTHHGTGVAAKLFQHLEDVAKERDCDALLLEVKTDNARAIRFYEKMGYEISGMYDAFYEDGTDALRMKKEI